MSVHDFWTPFSLLPFLNSLVIGLSIAAIWLIAALGLAVIYGTMRVINMAHGEFIMLGAYTVVVCQSAFGLPYLLTLPVAFLLVAVVGYIVERLLVQHLYRRPLDTLLATWGLSLVLIQAVRLTFGGEPQYVDIPDGLQGVMQLGPFTLSWLRIFIIAVSLAAFGVTWYLLYRTRAGVQVRAVTQNKEIAAAHGIHAQRIYSLTFAYGAGLAGLAGGLFAGLKTVFPDMGAGYIVEAFLVVVVGGAELSGSLVSSVLLGEMGSIFSYFTNDTFAAFVLYVLVVVFVRFRPQGLFPEGSGRR